MGVSLARSPTGSENGGPREADPAVFDLKLDRQSSIPAYQQLKFHIIHAVSTQRLFPGDVMPSVREASEKLGLAPATVQRTYGELKQEGILASKPGHYVYVTDVADRADREPGPGRQSSLQDLLVPVYVTARSMGFSDSEILDTIHDLTAGPGPTRQRPRLAFIGEGQRVLDKYMPIMREAVASLDAEVIGLDLNEFIENDGAALEENGPVHLIVSIVSWMGAVREIGLRHDIQTVGLLVEPAPETKRILAALPYGSKIGLISEPRYVTNVAAIIEQLCGSQIQIVTAIEETKAARKTLEDCDAYVRTFRTEKLAAAVVPEGAEVTEFKFLPVKASLDHIEGLLLKVWLESDQDADEGADQLVDQEAKQG